MNSLGKKSLFSWFFALVLLLGAQYWLLDIRQVEGRSMVPTFHPGRIIVTFRWAYGIPLCLSPGYHWMWNLPNAGDLVVFRAPPGDHFSVKRVSSLDRGLGTVILLGDNEALSRDSRDFGPVPVEEILGRVVF